MTKLLFAMLLVAAACGGTKKTPQDLSTSGSHEDMALDLAAPQDFAGVEDFAKKTPPDAASDGTQAEVTAACMHICACYVSSATKSQCSTVCNARDARYYNAGSSGISGYYPFTSSGGASSVLSYMFVTASSIPPVSGQSSTASNPVLEPTIPPSECLSCLASATCTVIGSGAACSNVCPSYE